MREFIEDHEWEVLLIITTMLAITRWWIPSVIGFENIYVVSQWVLSYDYGLVRRGLTGTLFKVLMPIVSVEGVHHTALVVYCTFLVLLLVLFYALLKYKDKNGRLFRLILLFSANPATLSLYARDLGRFDILLIMIMLLSLTLLSLKRHLWLIPILMTTAMFIHEGFLILCAPTILAAMMFVYLWDKQEKRVLVTIVASAISTAGAFLVLYKFGNPTLGYEEFSRLIQLRANFHITNLSMRECYYGIKDHVALAAPYLQDPGSIFSFLGALLMLSPIVLILMNLWTHALRNCGAHRAACWLFLLATLSGLLIMFIATDHGRWLSAVIFSNFFALFFLMSRDVIKIEDLTEYSGDSFPLLFVLILVTYLFFGPLHDWNPYPYQNNVIYSSFSIASVLLFDIGFIVRWRTLRERTSAV